MGRVTLFECDVTGERFGARNDVYEIGVRQRRGRDPTNIHKYDIHLSDGAVEDSPIRVGLFTGCLEYVTVDGNEVDGCGMDYGDGAIWFPHDDVRVESYEPLFKWLENEVIV